MMRIALDYDETYTQDKPLWDMLVRRVVNDTIHTITFVTLRGPEYRNKDIEADAKRLGLDIVYCDGKQKSTCFTADVWIDDSPLFIPNVDAMRGVIIGCEKLGE